MGRGTAVILPLRGGCEKRGSSALAFRHARLCSMHYHRHHHLWLKSTNRASFVLVKHCAFSQTGVFDQDSTIELLTQSFDPTSHEGEERLYSWTKCFVPSRKRDSRWNLFDAQPNRSVQVLHQAAILRFDGGNAPNAHYCKEHDKKLIDILKRMSAMGNPCLALAGNAQTE